MAKKFVVDLDMRLSKNFTLREMIRSSIAQRLGIDNTPTSFKVIEALTLLCQNVLQPIRDHFKKPVHVNSGYRGPKLNNATPGSSRRSQHRKGEAGDIEIYGVSNLKLAQWIDNNIFFDQLILEYHTAGRPNSGWVHVSIKLSGLREQVLSKLSGEKRYRKGLVTQ
ncbi:MAG: D-Ala-D-Ala carboxypeptidase family metallohydrolase [Candidatus Thorarchaeota archaeon]|nr:MAG: peptidase M15A [Candidatus Fermentibacteria bacterium]HEC72035.1 DUF882 domain-containing protein [Thermoplasmatales archaeon]